MIELHVEGMTCGHCVSAVTQAVKSVDPRARVDVDLATGQVRIETVQGREALAAAIEEAGYAAR